MSKEEVVIVVNERVSSKSDCESHHLTKKRLRRVDTISINGGGVLGGVTGTAGLARSAASIWPERDVSPDRWLASRWLAEQLWLPDDEAETEPESDCDMGDWE